MKYEIRSLGIIHPDYFQGAGTAFTNWESVSVGIGTSEKEAFLDALEQVDEISLELEQEENNFSSVHDAPDDMFYHVAIYQK